MNLLQLDARIPMSAAQKMNTFWGNLRQTVLYQGAVLSTNSILLAVLSGRSAPGMGNALFGTLFTLVVGEGPVLALICLFWSRMSIERIGDHISTGGGASPVAADQICAVYARRRWQAILGRRLCLLLKDGSRIGLYGTLIPFWADAGTARRMSDEFAVSLGLPIEAKPGG